MENKFTINEQKMLSIFFNYPTTSFSAREVARLTKITHPTVLSALNKLSKLSLVRKEITKNKSGIGKNHSWMADNEKETFRQYKKLNNLKNIYLSKLISKVVRDLSPNTIVLFGSYSRGEDIEGSDIDLFVQSSEKELNLKSYEQKLHRKINITFVNNIKEIKQELLQNVINGVVLHGYLEVIQ